LSRVWFGLWICALSFLSSLFGHELKHRKTRPINRSRIAKVSKKCPSTTFRNIGNSALYEGAGSRIRTDDLLITNQLLYQLSYAGEGWSRSLQELQR
jgi:hypothetical protein